LRESRRVVDRRRGELLGDAVIGGDRSEQVPTVEPAISKAARNRYRLIARYWPRVLDALQHFTTR
jgi:hypothetical protein